MQKQNGFWSLNIRIYNLFVIWCLLFGILLMYFFLSITFFHSTENLN